MIGPESLLYITVINPLCGGSVIGWVNGGVNDRVNYRVNCGVQWWGQY